MQYKTDLMHYLPPYYQDVEEMKILCQTEEQELHRLREEVEALRQNQYVDTLTLEGVRRYEGMLSLRPHAGETLAFRRRRIWSTLMTKPPFTHGFYRAYYNAILGEGRWEEEMNREELSYVLYIDNDTRDFQKELSLFLDKTVPLHVQLSVHVRQIDAIRGFGGFATAGTGEVMTKMIMVR